MYYNQLFIVDDNTTTVDITSLMLSRLLPNAKTVGYSDGSLLLEHIITDHSLLSEPTLVILDINMPGATGFEVLDDLENRFENLDNLHVIMMTASNMAKDRELAQRYPCIKQFVEKPLRLSSLANFISEEYYPAA